jgi:hypothetical protein
MRFLSLAVFLTTTVLGYAAIYVYRGLGSVNAVYVDRWGDRWRIPTNGWATKITNKCIEMIPRFSTDFAMVDPDFDLESQYYLKSSGLYILFCGLVGLLFLVIVGIFFLCRYCFGCCGGKSLPRRGYARDDITCARLAIVILSFLLEGVLIFGYFANSDLDISLGKLVKVFQGIGQKLSGDIHYIIDRFPVNLTGNSLFDTFKEDFKADLRFSATYALAQTSVMKDMTDGFEGGRMALVILTLIVATFGCSVGIAAGSLNRGWPVMIMVGLNTVAVVMIFFSTGFHFTGSKIMYEYCDGINYYLTNDDEVIPQRLQFFVPCVASPVFPYIQDYFVIQSVLAVNEFNTMLLNTSLLQDISNDYRYSPAQWFNVTNSFYQKVINEISESEKAKRDELQEYYNGLKDFVTVLLLVDDSAHCRWSKNEMRAENFLFCVYLKDNLDMMTCTQAVGAVILVIITLIGIPAIRKFEWAGHANMGGILNAGQRAAPKGARAKRKA